MGEGAELPTLAKLILWFRFEIKPKTHLTGFNIEEEISNFRLLLPSQIYDMNDCKSRWRWKQAAVEDLKETWTAYSEYVCLPYPFIDERDDELWADFCFRLWTAAATQKLKKPLLWS